MKRYSLRTLIATVAVAVWITGIAPFAGAVPISGSYKEDARGDSISDQLLSEELGDDAIFPLASAVHYHDHRQSGPTIGVPDDTVANDWTVHIENITGQAWKNLFFVADAGTTIGNSDGKVEDLIGAPGSLYDAFRIDGSGVNPNLLSESMTADGIFEIGEEWEFAVSNFGTGINSLPPALITPGVFSGSSPFGGIGGTNSSILATPVPEPGTAGVLGMLAAVILLRRPTRMWVPFL